MTTIIKSTHPKAVPIKLMGHFLLKMSDGTNYRLDLETNIKNTELSYDKITEIDFSAPIAGDKPLDGWIFTGRLKRVGT